MLHVSLSSHPVAGRPFSGRKAASNERNEAESVSILTARAFDPPPLGECPPHGGRHGSHGEVALIHGAAVFMSSE